jgi:hypothetical protein
VDVSLDPPALVVGGRLDPGPRVVHLADQRRRLHRETLMVKRHDGIQRDGGDEGLIVTQRGVVDDRGHPAIIVANLRQATPRPWWR